MAGLAALADRGWMAATDDSSEETVTAVGPEAIYKLGFLNGLQATIIGAAAEGEERELVHDALREAAELLDSQE